MSLGVVLVLSTCALSVASLKVLRSLVKTRVMNTHVHYGTPVSHVKSEMHSKQRRARHIIENRRALDIDSLHINGRPNKW